tara:strand:+ start:530 stop:961 length:432 start_codon:yes stop_codon:yes gene_type:complete
MSKLVETAKRCKEILQNTEYKLDMVDWAIVPGAEFDDYTFKIDRLKELAADKNACGTTYCLAGFLALEADYPKEYVTSDGYFDHITFAADAVGTKEFSTEYDFLFNAAWSSKLELVHKRLDYVIEHDAVPCLDDWKEYGWYDE